MSDEHVQETVKHSIDGVAAFTTIGALAELLPPVAALFTIGWTGLRIYILIENRIRTGRWKS